MASWNINIFENMFIFKLLFVNIVMLILFVLIFEIETFHRNHYLLSSIYFSHIYLNTFFFKSSSSGDVTGVSSTFALLRPFARNIS